MIAARPRAVMWALVAAVSALVIAGAALVVADNLSAVAPPQTGGGSMVVYLGEGVSDEAARQLAAQLARVTGVDKAELVAPAEAAKRLERALGADAALLDGVDLASLPATVEATLSPGVRDVIAMSPILSALRATPGVDDVIVEDAPIAREGLSAPVRSAIWTAAGLLAALALVVVLAAVRVRLERDKKEQQVLHLLGASPAFTAVPTALAGALLGLFAGLCATIVLGVGMLQFGDDLAQTLAVPSVTAPALGAIALFVVAATTLGMIAGGLAGVSRVAR